MLMFLLQAACSIDKVSKKQRKHISYSHTVKKFTLLGRTLEGLDHERNKKRQIEKKTCGSLNPKCLNIIKKKKRSKKRPKQYGRKKSAIKNRRKNTSKPIQKQVKLWC